MSRIHSTIDIAMTAFQVGAFGLLGAIVSETIRNVASLRRDQLETKE
jgi:hypothetical protein